MKIKKKDLRKRLAQLPINYPDPTVTEDGIPGGHLDLGAELHRVELLCRRLAHNEVVVRDACLKELPQYIQRISEAVAEMETEYTEEMQTVLEYFNRVGKVCPYHYDNIIKALKVYREKEFKEMQRKRRQESMKEYKKRKMEERREKAMAGKFGLETPEEEEEEEPSEGEEQEVEPSTSPAAVHRERYNHFMQAWCDLELVYLKLCRGLHFCLWHSDKPLVQLACAQEIADLLNAAPTRRTKMVFYASLFRVLSREWSTIDRYRLDKYLALVRRMWKAWVQLMKEEEEKGKSAEPQPGVKPTAKSPQKKVKSATPTKTKSSTATSSANGKKKNAPPAALTGEKKRKRTSSTKTPVESFATAISMTYITAEYGETHPQLSQALSEMFYLFQEHIFPSKNSVGLTMHLCDVAFDELNKAFLSPTLFIALSAGVPLFAMSQGNFVEKRVLDFFFPPIAGGVLFETRKEQIALSLKRRRATLTRRDKKAPGAAAIDAELVEKTATEQVEEIVEGLIDICKEYSVSLGTVRAVRVMFSEAMQVLQQVLRPEEYEPLTERAVRRRVQKELAEVADTRKMVKEVRSAVKEDKRSKVKAKLMERVKERKKKGGKNMESVDDKTILRQLKEEEKTGKKKATRNTKRKKNYQLTKEDLYGDGGKNKNDEDED